MTGLFDPDVAARVRQRDALVAGEAGMNQAADHADRERAGWCNDAFVACADLIAQLPADQLVTAEQLRIAVEREVPELPAPPDLRAWGRVIRTLVTEGWLDPTDQFARRASGHGSPTRVYRVQTP